MQPLNTRILLSPATLLLLLAVIAVGYQVASAQNSPGSLGGETALKNK